MIRTTVDRKAMKALAPDLVADCERDLQGPAGDISYVVAWAVAPGGQTVPGPGEPDADALRAWAERSLMFQLRGYSPGRKGSYRRPRGSFVIPDAVVDRILALAKDEHALDPSPHTLMPRLAAAIRENRVPAPEPRPDLVPEPEYELPVPSFRP